MNSNPIAKYYFDLVIQAALAEEKVETEIIKILGKNPDEPDTWGFDDITHDWYDCSFELKGCVLPLPVLTRAQGLALRALGYHQYWFCTKPAGEYDPGVHAWLPK